MAVQRGVSSILLVTLLSLGLPGQAAIPSGSPVPSAVASPVASPEPVPPLAWRQTIPAQGPRGRLSQVIAWSGGFAALGQGASGRPTVWVSPDGSAWTSHRSPVPPNADPQLGALGGRLILVAGLSTRDGPRLASWSSTDAARWRRAPDSRRMVLPGHPTWGHFEILGPMTAGGRAVVVGSWDGCCGSILTPIADSGVVSLALAGPDRLVGTYAWTTTDGLRWTRHPVVGPQDSLECLAADGERFLGIDYDSPLLASSDGVHWETVGEVPFVQSADQTACVHRTASGYLQVGEIDAPRGYNISTGTAVSTDAATWSAPSTLLGFETETDAIAVLGDLVVFPGYQHAPDLVEPEPAHRVSMDGGVTWSPTSDWPQSTAAATDGRVIVAVGDGAWVAPLPGPPVPVARPVLAPPVRASGPPPEVATNRRPDASVTRRGIRLDVWIADRTVRRGQWVSVRARVTNVGRRPTAYAGDVARACTPLRFELDVSGLFDPGRRWTGNAASLKRAWLTQEDGPMTVAGGVTPGGGGCDEMPKSATLRPGESMESGLVALPRYGMREQPLPPGPLRLAVSYLDAGRGHLLGPLRRLTITDTIHLTGTPVDYPSPGQLADAALLTPGVLAVVDSLPDPRGTWENPYWRFQGERPYPGAAWSVRADAAPDGILEVGLFPSTGSIGFLDVILDPWTGESFGRAAP